MTTKSNDSKSGSTGRRMFLKGLGATAGAVGVGAGANKYVPRDRQIDGSAEALIAASTAALYLGGAVISGGTLAYINQRTGATDAVQDLYNNLLDGSNRSDSTDSPMLEDIHGDLISLSGTMNNLTNDFSNDLNQFEGEIEQYLSRKIINNTDQFDSKTSFTEYVEQEQSEFLWRDIKNLQETYVLNGYDIYAQQQRLQTTGNGSDMGIATVYNIDSDTSFPISPTNAIVNVTGDIDLTGGAETTDTLINGSGTVLLFLNGHTIKYGNGNGIFTAENMEVYGDGGKLHHVNSTSANDTVLEGFTGVTANVYNVTLQTDADLDSGGHYGSVDYFDKNVTYLDSTGSEVSPIYTANNDSTESSSEFDISISLDTFTYKNADLSTTKPTYNNGETSLTAEKIPVDTSYKPSDQGDIYLPAPYRVSDGTPVSQITDASIVAETSTSGNNDYVEVADYSRIISLFESRDSLAASTYTSIQTWADGIWQQNFASLSDPTTVLENTDISQDLGTFSYPDFSPETPEQVNSVYAGNFENVERPVETTQKYTVDSTGTQYTGILYSTDLTAATSATSDPSTIAEGDSLDLSSPAKSFIVKDSNAQKIDVTGETLTVDTLTRPDTPEGETLSSVPYRTFNFSATDLVEESRRLTTKREVTDQVSPDTGGAGFFSSPINVLLSVVGLGGLAYYLQQQSENGGSGGSRGRNRRY